jgi:transcriptional regulator with XRE-family HTH domain
MRKAFAKNMIQCRQYFGWSQQQAADAIGIEVKSLASYEEGRAFPSVEKLLKIIQGYRIENVIEFISGKANLQPKTKEQKILQKYYALKAKEKKAVDVLLGM